MLWCLYDGVSYYLVKFLLNCTFNDSTYFLKFKAFSTELNINAFFSKHNSLKVPKVAKRISATAPQRLQSTGLMIPSLEIGAFFTLINSCCRTSSSHGEGTTTSSSRGKRFSVYLLLWNELLTWREALSNWCFPSQGFSRSTLEPPDGE